ncbi:MAG: methionine adenosyltransferase [Bifidobacteriaceae bacterium]|jgi:S-adenosylmethionine synthetase|nr:methionine adenosyltransferase [Bifidobacteriaceae bacterium]
MSESRLFTSESVTGGHPDKLCDQISDAVLDQLLAEDPRARVAVECLISHGQVVVAGEVTTEAYAPVADVAREVLLAQGYDSAETGIDGASCGVSVLIEGQSREIAAGVDRALEARGGGRAGRALAQGAGDQGMMFGYAVDETPELMPLPIHLAHQLAERLERVRLDGELGGLRPDGKTQVTVRYVDGRPAALDTVVVSAQHAPQVDEPELARAIGRLVVEPVVAAAGLAAPRRVLVNPSGSFVVGGPAADTGVTGRKIIVDTYGGMARHGGGAFSGKDPSKVDRSAAYAARWAAKNIVAAGLARRAELQVAYAIGAAQPVSLAVETFGTGAAPDAALARAVGRVFDLRPAAIIEALDLLRPVYLPTATFGHFGRPGLAWEQPNRVEDLLRAV